MAPTTPLDLLTDARRAILVALKENGEATAEQLAERAFLSIGAVRLHVASLIGQGLVTYRRQAQKAGRPVHLHRLTDAGESLFGQGAYVALVDDIFAALDRRPDLKREVFDLLFESHCEELQQSVVGSTEDERVSSLIGCLRDQGYIPAFDALNGDWRIELRHCPLIQVARKHPEFCEMELRAITSALPDRTAVRETDRRQGDVICSYLISKNSPPH